MNEQILDNNSQVFVEFSLALPGVGLPQDLYMKAIKALD
jgi:hypothetical protein